MENNFYAANQQNSDPYYNLGKSMKNYAVAIIILAAIGIIGTIIVYGIVLIPLMSGGSPDSFEMASSYILLSSIASMGSLGLSVFLLIRYIQYLSNLKRAGNVTGDFNLQKSFKMEIGVIIGSIILPVILLIVFTPLMVSMIYDQSYNSIITSVVGTLLLSLLVVAFLYMFQIMAMISLERWAQGLRNSNNNMVTISIAEGISYMKWGRIVSPFTGGIGAIIYLVGMMKAGKYLMQLSPMDNQGAHNQPAMQSYYAQTETSFSNSREQTYRPQNGKTTTLGSGYCSTCGKEVINSSSAFCQHCGNKL